MSLDIQPLTRQRLAASGPCRPAPSSSGCSVVRPESRGPDLAYGIGAARAEQRRVSDRGLGGAVPELARCLSWLGREYRDGRLRGGVSDLHGRIGDIGEGVSNLPCGGDSFDCTWNGRRHTVDWHIKNGTNTRDPRRCLTHLLLLGRPHSQGGGRLDAVPPGVTGSEAVFGRAGGYSGNLRAE